MSYHLQEKIGPLQSISASNFFFLDFNWDQEYYQQFCKSFSKSEKEQLKKKGVKSSEADFK